MEFPPVLVINLDERTDRWEAVQKAFASWPIELERIPAIKQTPGWKGCLQSHKKAVRYAMEQQYPWVLVLEDDCFPGRGARSYEQFRDLLPLLWESRDKWELFSGGPTLMFEQKLVNKHPPLFEQKSYAAHFMLIQANAYQKILDAPEEQIDVFYKKQMKCLCTYPHIAYQSEGMSDIEGRLTNYMFAFENSSRTLMHELYGYQYEVYFGFAIVFALLTVKALAS